MRNRIILIALICAVSLFLFGWYQLRPSIIRSICQDRYKHVLNDLKKINEGFCLKKDVSEDTLKEIKKHLGSEGNSPGWTEPTIVEAPRQNRLKKYVDPYIECDQLVKNELAFLLSDRHLKYADWKKLNDEQRKLFKVAPSTLESIALYRKEAQFTYDACLREYGLK